MVRGSLIKEASIPPVYSVSCLEPLAAQRNLGDAIVRDLPAVAAVEVLQLRTQFSDSGKTVVSNLQRPLK